MSKLLALSFTQAYSSRVSCRTTASKQAIPVNSATSTRDFRTNILLTHNLRAPKTANRISSQRLVMSKRASSSRTDPPPPSKEEAQKEAQKLVDDAVSKPYLKLALCLFIDLIGMSSYLLPVVGEAGDFAWAPIEAYLLMTMFGSNAIAGFGFIEEALPGLDFIPTATIAWFIENNPNLAGVKKALFPKQ